MPVSALRLPLRGTAGVLLVVAYVMPAAWGQEPVGVPRRFREAVTLDTNGAVTKRLGAVQEYLASRQWEQAIDILAATSESHGDSLLAVAPGRYVNVAYWCQLLLAGMPPDALAAYRLRVDPQARRWYEAGIKGDAASLEKVVRRAFASSYGDEALARLAEQAWDRGDLAAARRLWEQLVPLDPHPEPGKPLPVLRYPDPTVPAGEVLARLVMCSLLEGRLDRADRELDVFARRFGDSEGYLSGRQGNLLTLLRQVRGEAAGWTFPAESRGVPTFAGSRQRSRVLPEAVDIGVERWVARLPSNRMTVPTRRPALDEAPLSYFPATRGNMALVSDGLRIYAYRIHAPLGKDLKAEPYWPNGLDDSGVIHPSAVASVPAPDFPIGIPRHTLTVHEGRLYAKLGTPVTGRSKHEHREVRSDLVCLDLSEEKQGQLLWDVSAPKLVEGEGSWAFEGAPVVDRGRAYIVMRKSHPQMQLNVVCFDADAGRLVWNRKVCTAVSPLGDQSNLITHLLLTLGDDALYLSTDLGAVAAIELHDGTLRWVATYETREGDVELSLSDPQQNGLLPCVYAHGTVVAAPNDHDGILAFDPQTGHLRWEVKLDGGVRDLLGATPDGLLIVGGRTLWGIDLRTGRIAWPGPTAERVPEGYGRGILAADLVYWPTRDRIYRVEHRTGRVLFERSDRPGGNLTIADGALLVAGPESLVAYGEYGGLRKKAERDRAAAPNRPETHVRLAQVLEAEGKPNEALDRYREAIRLSEDDRSSDGFSAQVARGALFALLSRLGQEAAERKDASSATRRWTEALDVAPDALARAATMRKIAETAGTAGDSPSAIAAWRRLKADVDLADLPLPVRTSEAGVTSVPVGRLATEALVRIERQSARPSGREPSEVLGPPEAGGPQASTIEPGPWLRRWERTLAEHVELVVPLRQPPGDAGCHLESGADLICRGLERGATLWERRGDPPVVWGAFAGGHLVVGGGDGLRGLDARTGELRWRVPFPSRGAVGDASEIPEPKPRFHVNVRGGIAAFDGLRTLISVDPADGSLLWQHEIPPQRAPPLWGDSAGEAFLQLADPPRIIRLSLLDGRAEVVRLAPPVAWRSPPVGIGRGRMALVTEGLHVWGIAANGRPAWRYSGGLSWANADPDLWSNGEALLLIVDGDTLVRLAPDSGVRLWSLRLAREPVQRASRLFASDESRVYVAFDGLLRAVTISEGRTVWETRVGPPEGVWQATRIGRFALAWPVRPQAQRAPVACVEASTGALVQKLEIKKEADQSAAVLPCGSSLTVLAGRKIFAFGPIPSGPVEAASR